MFLLLFLKQVLEMSTPDLAAELSSFPGVPGHAPDLLLAQVHCEVINDGLQLINGLGLTPHHMGQSLSPQWKVQGGQVWWVGGPVVFSVTRDHAITKLGLDEVQAVLGHMAAGPVLSCWNQYCFLKPKKSLKISMKHKCPIESNSEQVPEPNLKAYCLHTKLLLYSSSKRSYCIYHY